MHTTRREALKLAGSGAVVLAGVSNGTAALAQAAAPAAIEYGNASSAESELRIVNFDLLEADAKKILPHGRFAFMGPAGDGWTFRENRRAFDDIPIMPRRLQGVNAEDIDLRITLMGHDLPFPRRSPVPVVLAWPAVSMFPQASLPRQWKILLVPGI